MPYGKFKGQTMFRFTYYESCTINSRDKILKTKKKHILNLLRRTENLRLRI